VASHLMTFTDSKVRLAAALNGGLGGGTYGEAILVTSSLLSAIAAYLWPGDRIDRARFVELWHSHASPSLAPTLISLPLLITARREVGDMAAVKALESTSTAAFCGDPEYDSLVLEGPSVDLPETQVCALVPHLSRKEIRHYTYPAVFYREVRSPYVHEFSSGRQSSASPMSTNENVVSYVNQSPHRTIHFGMGFLDAVVRSIAASADNVFANAPLRLPATWWENA
jgi:hypothetical protein